MAGSFQYGTAESLNKQLPEFGPYDVYAKTGTIGTSNKDNSKRLILVIMKKGDPAPIKNRKKYFLYFSAQNAYEDQAKNGWFLKCYADVIRKVIRSSTFQAYMK